MRALPLAAGPDDDGGADSFLVVFLVDMVGGWVGGWLMTVYSIVTQKQTMTLFLVFPYLGLIFHSSGLGIE